MKISIDGTFFLINNDVTAVINIAFTPAAYVNKRAV